MAKANLKPTVQSEVFSELDWNFDAVPDDELVVCSYWEYARESARIRAAFTPDDNGDVRVQTGLVFSIARRPFFEQIIDQAFPVLRIFHHASQEVTTPFDAPWQAFSAGLRRAVIAELAPASAKQPSLPFLPFNRCPDLHDLGLAVAGYRCATLDAESGVEYLRVQIDWAGFTDAQIIAAFKVWLAKNRPAGVGVASAQGLRLQKGYRGYLAWLGMLRLMSICPFTSLEKERPNAWRCYGKTDWPRARKKAAAVFKALFPFLPRADAMIHWQTAGGRGK